MRTRRLIREARPGDGERLARLWLDSAAYYVERFPAEFRMPDEEGLADWLEARLRHADDEVWLVAELDGELVGYLNARLAPPDPDAARLMLADRSRPRLYVEWVGTAAPHRRRSVAGELVRAAEEWGRRRGAVAARATTPAESEVSLPFWERGMGYRRVGVVFSKRLA